MNIHRNIIFISDISENALVGASQKIKSQLNAFQKISKVTFVTLESRKDKALGEHIISIKKNRINEVLFFFILIWKIWKMKRVILYIRNPNVGLTPLFFIFFLSIRKFIYRDCIILEIPTYPYKQEKKGILSTISYYSHVLNRPILKFFIDSIVIFTPVGEKIWGIKTIRVPNGISLIHKIETEIILRKLKEKQREESNELNFLSLAHISNWHGIDRFIKGLSLDRNVLCKLYIISRTTKELMSLEEDIIKNNLQEKIVVYKDLSENQIFNVALNCHIGIDSIGRHRVGNTNNSSLKSKDYLFLGLPIIFSHSDVDLDNLPFTYKIPANEDPVKIRDIIEWYRKKNFLFNEIHDFAVKKFDWVSIFESIIDNTHKCQK